MRRKYLVYFTVISAKMNFMRAHTATYIRYAFEIISRLHSHTLRSQSSNNKNQRVLFTMSEKIYICGGYTYPTEKAHAAKNATSKQECSPYTKCVRFLYFLFHFCTYL